MVFALHWLRQNRLWQNSILVLASYFFYGWWDYRFCALMLISSLVDYGIGLFVHNSKSSSNKRIGLGLSIVCNLGLLGFFKYYNFFAENLVNFFGEFGWEVHPIIAEIILPVGISFYTFQTLSYTIDIYRGHLKPTKNLIDYLAFVSFFPQLVAGPIERATNLIPQFSATRKFNYEQAVIGCQGILWGFFKKLIVADRLASAVDAAYLDPTSTPGIALALATIFFAFQIYCDFSAYSDIAIGTAKLFNIDLMRNFNYPYFSTSVSQFWRRWHISLSTWFRDYVFIPLGGSRVSPFRTNVNLMITFVVSGLWHGAAWRFIVWGAINGAAIVVEKSFASVLSNATSKITTRIHPLLRNVLAGMATFSVVCLAWVFFRATDVHSAIYIVGKIALIPFYELNREALDVAFNFHPRITTNLYSLAIFASLEWFSREHPNPLKTVQALPLPIRWATYTAVLWLTIKFMLTTKLSPFIYFTF